MRLSAGFVLLTVLATSAAAQPAVRFSPVESFTVVYNATGLQSGTITQHSRKFGLEQSQINDVTFANGMRNRMQLITLGDKIITYDPAANRAGATPNPAFRRLTAAAAGKEGNDLSKALLQAVNFVPTGRMQNIAGETCMVWENKQFSLNQCATQDGIVLETRQTIQGATMIKTATAVRRGDPGPETAYSVPAGVQVQDVRSLNDLPVGR
jgi:hypothetical protein